MRGAVSPCPSQHCACMKDRPLPRGRQGPEPRGPTLVPRGGCSRLDGSPWPTRRLSHWFLLGPSPSSPPQCVRTSVARHLLPSPFLLGEDPAVGGQWASGHGRVLAGRRQPAAHGSAGPNALAPLNSQVHGLGHQRLLFRPPSTEVTQAAGGPQQGSPQETASCVVRGQKTP